MKGTIALASSAAMIAGLLAAAPVAGAAERAQPAVQPAVQPTVQPAQDACYDYRSGGTKAQAATAPAVPCEGPHTAQTFYVRSLPEGFGVPQDASAKKRLRVARACTTDAMNAYLGLTNTKIPSRFQIVTVFPTEAQWNAGERWMRCDVVLRGGKKFARFSGTAPALVAATPRDQFDFCTPNVPGSRTKAAYPCNKPKKNWIMVAERDLGSIKKNFPGTRKVERKAKRICERIGNRYTERKKFFPWWAIWPTRTGWKEGDRTAQCFVPYEEYVKTTQPSS